MLSCEHCQERLPEFVADGEPATPATAYLREHLVTCAACADLLERLRHVEDALHAYPQPAAPPALAARIVDEVAAAPRREPASWQWLPWDIGVPMLVLVVAIVVATLSAPPQAFHGGPVVDISPTTKEWNAVLDGWTSGLARQTDADPFLTLWIGGSILAAIVGIAVGLSAWRRADDASHELLQVRVERVGEWFDGIIGRTT